MTIKNKRLASLDIHSPLYLRTKESKLCGGDLDDMYLLVDKAAKAGFGLIQIAPIQDTGTNACPYMGISIFSYNPVFLSVKGFECQIDLEKIDPEIKKNAYQKDLDRSHYRYLYLYKMAVLRLVFEAEEEEKKISFNDFSEDELSYAVFKVLKGKFEKRWFNWPDEYKNITAKEVIRSHPLLHKEIKFILYTQIVARKQWAKLISYAEKKGISFIIDKPIYPGPDSADVWANQELFYLRKDGSPKYVSGCDNPGDPFGQQYWGHAVYKYKEEPQKVIDYYIKSIKHLTEISPVIRLDHTLALVWRYYIINSKTKKGKHVPAIKHKLFAALEKHFPNVLFVAEDVGFVSEKLITAPLRKHGIPGIRCLQWTVEPFHREIRDYEKLCVAMTSNHDVDSIWAWWNKLINRSKKYYYTQIDGKGVLSDKEVVWRLIELVFQSKAQIASITLRDILLDKRRYNLPGKTVSQNWKVRMKTFLEEVDFEKIAQVIKDSKRTI